MLDVALRWCASNIDLALTTVQSAGTGIDHVGPSEMNVTWIDSTSMYLEGYSRSL